MSVFLAFFSISVCPIGLFGAACNKICGNCRDVSQCHPITGTCVSGCVAGYEGNKCKTREYKCNQALMYILKYNLTLIYTCKLIQKL